MPSVSRADALAARETLSGRLHTTPVFSSATLDGITGARVFLKAELFQRTGSFKPRGILNRIAALSAEERRRGVISISAGNAAQAVAWAAAEERTDAVVVMWQTASPQKIEATRSYGAEVDLEAAGPAEAFDRVRELTAASGRVFVHPYDDPLVIAGHATLGLELAEQVPSLGLVLVPVGGGGLVSGVAVGCEARVVAVEPEGSPALHAGLEAGRPVPVRPSSIADALSAPVAGELCLEVCRERGVESVLVSDEEIEKAMRLLYGRAKLACEPGAAAGVAALIGAKVRVEPGASIGVVVSGGNVAPATAVAILDEQ